MLNNNIIVIFDYPLWIVYVANSAFIMTLL